MEARPPVANESADLAAKESLLDADQLRALVRLNLVFCQSPQLDGVATPQATDSLRSTPDTSDSIATRSGSILPTIGRFRLQRFLGEGTFGVVYEAIDQVNGQQVAVKIARPSVPFDEKSRERFLSEARIASRLQHEGIARIYDVGDDQGVLYLVSQFCNGCTLDRWVFGLDEQTKYLEIARLLAQVARTVEFGHRKGVIHRDLKPANIIVVVGDNDPPSPIVLDFGLAIISEDGLRQTSSSVLLGTPLYMSPEQLDGKPASTACDIFAMGVILYECLVGVTPFDAFTLPDVFERIRLGRITSPRSQVRNLPVPLEAICMKCVRYQPGHRYASASALAEDLEAFVDGRAVRAKLPSRLASFSWCLRRPQLPQELSLLLVAVNGLVLAWAVVNFPLAMFVLPQTPEQSSTQGMYWPVVAAIIPVHSLLLAMSFRLLQGRQTRRGICLHLSLTIAIALLAAFLICVPAPLSTLTRFEKVGALGLVASFAELQTLALLVLLRLKLGNAMENERH